MSISPRIIPFVSAVLLLPPMGTALAIDKLEEQKLVASDAEGGDDASRVALSGDVAVVGAPGEDTLGSLAGAAYVFEKTAGVWSEIAKLLPSDGNIGDIFGSAVAIDGDTIAIGAQLDDDAGLSSGSVYVFERVGATFAQTQKLTASDASAADQFGAAVSISGDVLLVGAPTDAVNGGFSGSAYAFERVGGAFVEVQKLIPSDATLGDTFGAAIAVSGDLAIVGALGDDDNGSSAGSCYAFRRQGGVWTEVAKALASDGAAGDQLGFAVAVDGTRFLVGAPRKNGVGVRSGAAYVFELNGAIVTEVAKLAPGDTAANDLFGSAVSVSGGLFAIGAPDKGGAVTLEQQGAAYLFEDQGGALVEIAKLAASDAGVDVFGGDRLGFGVAVSGDVVIASAPDHDSVAAQSSATYVYDRRVLPYGGGCPGQSGAVPTFHVRGHPEVGNTVRIEIAGGEPLSFGVLFASPLPGSILVEGCALLLDPSGLLAVGFPLGATGALEVEVQLPLAWQGASLASQVLLHDSVLAPKPAGTNSLSISVD